jgi:predicted DNA-binding transcriptional regulator AlpA
LEERGLENNKTIVKREKELRPKDELLTVPQAAKYLTCGKTWLYNCINAGTLPYPLCLDRYDFGLRFRVSILDAYLRFKQDSAGTAGRN